MKFLLNFHSVVHMGEAKLNHSLAEQLTKICMLRKCLVKCKWNESERTGTSTIIHAGERFHIIVICTYVEEYLNSLRSPVEKKQDRF